MEWTYFEKYYSFENQIFESISSFVKLINLEYEDAILSDLVLKCDCKTGEICHVWKIIDNKNYTVNGESKNKCIKNCKTIQQNIDVSYDEDNESGNFRDGFLNSLRKIIVALETTESFQGIKKTKNFKILLLEANTDNLEYNAEKLMNETRKIYVA